MKRNRIICQELAVNGKFLPKNRLFVKLPEQIKVFRKFAWKNRNVLPGSTTPRFQTRLTPLSVATLAEAWPLDLVVFVPSLVSCVPNTRSGNLCRYMVPFALQSCPSTVLGTNWSSCAVSYYPIDKGHLKLTVLIYYLIDKRHLKLTVF